MIIKLNKNEIDIKQTLECGQVFSYKTTDFGFCVYSATTCAVIIEHKNHYDLITTDPDYFVNYFDLNTNYTIIKNKIQEIARLTFGQASEQNKLISLAINRGNGIHILKQNHLETLISFCISANNNIKRITATLFAMRENFGSFVHLSQGFCDEIYESLTGFYFNSGNLDKNNLENQVKMALESGGIVQKGDKIGYFAFPNLSELQKISEEDFRKLGTGYRASQLCKLVHQLVEIRGQKWAELDTKELKNRLIDLSGVGPKVADCVLLFAFSRGDVFPVDTWIAKVFREYFGDETNRVKMRERLVEIFGDLSGYAQQYIFNQAIKYN